uniref:17-beta-hydroxysteroid dehydrogenase 13 n=2 Tax=Cacopsylla melanoneura TaxID=428564 RepID=A0A8D8PN33_9HEMI
MYNLFRLVYSSLEFLIELYWLGIKISFAFVESGYRFFSPKPLKRLNTERILVIGTGRGLGRELALQLSCHGAEVICWDVDEKSNQATVNETRHFNGRAIAFTCDVTNRADVRRVAERTRQEVGEVTMVIQCCGLSSPHALLNRSLQKVKQTFELSVLSHFWLLDEFLPPMLSSGRGHWVTLSSVAGLTGQPHHTSMAASQFAVQGLSEALAQQYWKKPNIHVTLVHIYPFLLSADLKSNIRLRLLPRKSSQIIRDLLDTGVDFG